MKRGELSMEVIIIAAIALLVLVILSVLIITRGKDVNDNTQCESNWVNGMCTDKDSACDEGYFPGSGTGCAESEKCCIPRSVG